MFKVKWNTSNITEKKLAGYKKQKEVKEQQHIWWGHFL